jgi:hypothetical protein
MTSMKTILEIEPAPNGLKSRFSAGTLRRLLTTASVGILASPLIACQDA